MAPPVPSAVPRPRPIPQTSSAAAKGPFHIPRPQPPVRPPPWPVGPTWYLLSGTILWVWFLSLLAMWLLILTGTLKGSSSTPPSAVNWYHSLSLSQRNSLLILSPFSLLSLFLIVGEKYCVKFQFFFPNSPSYELEFIVCSLKLLSWRNVCGW